MGISDRRGTENQKNDVWNDTGTALRWNLLGEITAESIAGEDGYSARGQGEAAEPPGAFGAAAMDKVDYE